MVRVEMSFFLVKLRFFTGVHNRLSKSFRIANFPVSSKIVVSKVCNQEIGRLNLNTQAVINESGGR